MIERGMTYNVLNGAQDPARYTLIKRIVKHRKPLFVCMQELDGWHLGDRPRLQDFAESTGLKNFVFGNSNTDCKLAIFSKRKIIESEVITEGFHHCAIRVVLQGPWGPYEVWDTHLNPFDEDKRLEEAAYLSRAKGLVVMDGNHLSPHDAYHSQSLLEALSEDNNVRYTKENERREKELRFDVADYFAKQGFVDTAADLGATQNTFPAMLGTERFQYPIRLDYVFAPRKLAHTVHRVHVLKNLWTSFASDHFPVEFEFNEAALAQHSAIAAHKLELAA